MSKIQIRIFFSPVQCGRDLWIVLGHGRLCVWNFVVGDGELVLDTGVNWRWIDIIGG